jgi:hypothetical protein
LTAGCVIGPHFFRTLDSNNFTGTIPASWTDLANLQEVTLQPGNPDLCPVAPPGSYFYVCDATDILCIDTLPHDTAACAGAQPADSSGFPVVAVVVPVAVVVAMAALAAGVLWRRRRRRQAGDQYASTTKQGADLVGRGRECSNAIACDAVAFMAASAACC